MKIRALVDLDAKPEMYHWRITLPLSVMNTYPHIDARTIEYGSHIEEGTDIVIVPKARVGREANDRDAVASYFDLIRKTGATLVYDSDDDIWSESYIEYGIGITKRTDNLDELLTLMDMYEIQVEDNLWTLLQCDAVTVPTENLAQYVRTLVGSKMPVLVVPNAIDVAGFTKSLGHPLSDGRTTIGWAGGSRPQDDLFPMLTAWNTLAANRSDIEFVIAGWKPNLKTYPNLKVRYIPWTTMEKYPSSMQVDIGCVCVSDSGFSRRKTPIKAWEFALAGAQVVGSASLYNSEPIAVCDTTEDWVKVLSFYALNFEAREAMAKSYERHVRNQHDIEYNWLYWLDAYSKILYEMKKKNENTPVSV